MLKTIVANYARAAHFEEAFPVVEELIGHPSHMLAELNETPSAALPARSACPPDVSCSAPPWSRLGRGRTS